MNQKYSFRTRTQEPYSILLNRIEWFAKREEILKRDGYRCVKCGVAESEDTVLQVHHKHYVYGRDPWEYENSSLVTLCADCHSEVHLNHDTPIYGPDSDNKINLNLTRCTRCNGWGWIPEYQHIANGICFRCHGERYDEFIDNVENYAATYGVDVRDIDCGYRYMSFNWREFNKFFTSPPFQICKDRVIALDSAWVVGEPDICGHNTEPLDQDKKYVRLLFDDGRLVTLPLDYSTGAEIGDELDISKMLYRIAMRKKDRCLFLIAKGSLFTDPDNPSEHVVHDIKR